jgi:hypothetical protein
MLAGLVVELQFDRELDPGEVDDWEDPERWPPVIREAFPMVGHRGEHAGMSRVARAAVTPDRRAVRLELDLTDVATP